MSIYTTLVRYTDKRTGVEHVTTAERTVWEREAAPHFTLAGGFLVEHVPRLGP